MNILITSSRAPVALELIRIFGRAGHRVYATDTMRWTVGSHSRYLAQHIVTPPPRYDSAGFSVALQHIIERAQIDWLIPTSEEVFFVARHYQQLAARTRVFTEPLDVLDSLHHKHRFQQRCAGLSICTPRTVLVRDGGELHAALPCFPSFLLKPAYSRFATQIITNCGPRAGQLALASCRPTPSQPWLIQQYIEGDSICSYSTLHGGHVTTHCAYITPHKVNYGSGVQFESIDGAATLAIVQRLGAALSYTGQLSLDFILSEDQLYLLECNPRATSGVHLIDAPALLGGLTDPDQLTWVEPAGRRGQLTLALLASGLAQPGGWPTLLRDAARVRDVIFERADPLPALAQLRAVLSFAAISRRKRIGLIAAMTDDIEWNGEAEITDPQSARSSQSTGVQSPPSVGRVNENVVP
ncbi:MAG: ATP-grasp domain-containing protein [Roseiflexaceae bacterium]